MIHGLAVTKPTDTQTQSNERTNRVRQVVVEGEESNESKLLRQCEAMVEQIPPVWSVRELRQTMDARSDPDPLKTVLYQEIDRYNGLLGSLHSMLRQLVLAMQGLVSITPLLETVMEALLDFKVPKAWSKCYPSMKPLAAWMRDLAERAEAFEAWISDALPRVFWLPSFTYPSGFLTALLQTSARKNGIAIDTLSWEFPIVNQDPSSITQYAKDGAYIRGLFLEGARWDPDIKSLNDSRPKQLFTSMCVIHMMPIKDRVAPSGGVYRCPVYKVLSRRGTLSTTGHSTNFIMWIEVPSNREDIKNFDNLADQAVWIKAGVAAFGSLRY